MTLAASPLGPPGVRDLAFGQGLTLAVDEHAVHLAHATPLRTLSSALVGAGLGWSRHFCNFHVDKGYAGRAPRADLVDWLARRGLDAEQSVAMMTAVSPAHLALASAEAGARAVLAAVTAGVGNAVDITAPVPGDPRVVVGTINLTLFIDGHLDDGALVNAAQSVTEAKVRALGARGVRDPHSGTPATGTSTDCLAIAATQRGDPTPYAGSGTRLGRAIGDAVFRAVTASLAMTEEAR
ncbi:adenosylcobinamide amidohydrolase [Halomonas denitrificans]|uniref:adenosylcobinamide amidohydrolase n=1 Tax=Halomonas denitrificans TaxID=370769 RepID=UPI001FEAFE72|nr:adenosylcobinamide amidohydrolase [Halomonas denitrificans]